MEPAGERVIRVTSDEAEADEWDLALHAEEVPHRLEATGDATGDVWTLVVPDGEAAYATELLDDYDAERRERAAGEQAAPPPPPDGASALGVVTALGLIAFHAALAVAGEAARARWLAAGTADAALVLHGEPWRAVTALTLHADYMHVAGNAIAALILFTALGRQLGSGVAAWLVLVAGAAGNFLNALVHGAHHLSLGASTATFAAVGLLAALQIHRRKRSGARRVRAWVPVAGGLGLFAMLGTGGPSTDVLAHLLGLAAGLAIGVVAALPLRRRPGPALQLPLAAAAGAAVAGCWALALG
jgi:membrane associated rhomboid family serine protease